MHKRPECKAKILPRWLPAPWRAQERRPHSRTPPQQTGTGDSHRLPPPPPPRVAHQPLCSWPRDSSQREESYLAPLRRRNAPLQGAEASTPLATFRLCTAPLRLHRRSRHSPSPVARDHSPAARDHHPMARAGPLRRPWAGAMTTQAEMRRLEEEERAHFRPKGRKDATMMMLLLIVPPRRLPPL
jgi:hypothetical protein